MKNWHWAAIIGGPIILVAAAAALLLRGGDEPWVSKPPSASDDLVRIASFNIEELFDPNDDPKLSGENDDQPSEESHLEAIASAIRAVDADILALQGVESLDAVRWFNDTYLDALGYAYVAALDVGHERGIENAVLSRFPINDSRVWPTLRLGGNHPATAAGGPNPMAGKPMMFRRSPLMVTVEVPGTGPLTLFVVEHKGGDKFDYWRKAEAAAISKLCQQAGMSNRIVILGSFHCDPGDPSLEPYFQLGFTDALATKGDSEFRSTEASGDRTDLVLANRVIGGDLDPDTAFVLGGDFVAKISAGETKTSHLPVVIGLRVHQP